MNADNHDHSTSRTIVVRVAMSFAKRGGRKLLVAPAGVDPLTPPRARIDSTLIKAVARAFRWKAMLESGRYGSIADLAEHERINRSYLCRVLRLTLLAPDIIEAILDGRQSVTLQLDELLKPGPVLWDAQRSALGLERIPNQS